LLDGLENSEFNTYELVRKGDITWEAARADAETRGGHLVTVTSQAEWDEVYKLTLEAERLGYALGGYFPLGLLRDNASRTHRWITGEPFEFALWVEGYPVYDSAQEGVGAYGAPPHYWHNLPIGSRYPYYILEIERKTDPNNPDTDADGLKDGDEMIHHHTDPLKDDTDGDSLSDFEELSRWDTDPLQKDSDNDALTDDAEVIRHKTNPNKPDSDGDGYSDKTEVLVGSDPNQGLSLPGVHTSAYPAVEIEFTTVEGIKYQLEISADLSTWRSVGEPFNGTGQIQSRFIQARETATFVRVVVMK
jgi:hypothetical protein